MKGMLFVVGALLVACKHDDAGVPSSGSAKHQPGIPGQPPIEDMVRVPPSADGTVKEFYIDKYEVTAGQFRRCVSEKACLSPSDIDLCATESVDPWSGDKRPVNCIDPKLAEQYCAYRGKRLPEREEWLHAALGDDGRRYPWGTASPSCTTAVLHDPACPTDKSLAVGLRPDGASPYGAMDLVGNVSEIVFSPSLHGAGDYVLMGGNYTTAPETLAAGLQQGAPTGWSAPTFGFRCAWSPDIEKPQKDK